VSRCCRGGHAAKKAGLSEKSSGVVGYMGLWFFTPRVKNILRGMKSLLEMIRADFDVMIDEDVLQRALSKLRAKERKMLVFRFDLQWSYKKIAEHLGMPVPKVTREIAASLHRLRTEMNPAYVAKLAQIKNELKSTR
jgi:hypothetical protein